ncbi:MAG TPA: hypothetical protein VFV05_08800 [Methylomirabilota bacterium]|nr:hypothetical protein [Methylomirabilota bacterium]
MDDTTNTRSFPTLAVVGTYTGRLLVPGGFGDIHDVMNHLYPGIMTMGLAAMAEHAARHLGEHVPGLRDLPAYDEDAGPGAYADLAVERLGPTLLVPGPANTSNAEIEAAFDSMAAHVMRRR